MAKVTNVNFLYLRSNSNCVCSTASSSSIHSRAHQSNCTFRDSQYSEAHMIQLSSKFNGHSQPWINWKVLAEPKLKVKLTLNSVFAFNLLLRKQQFISLIITIFLITQNTADCIRMNHATHRRMRSRWVQGDDDPRQRRSNGGSGVIPSDGSGIPCVYEGRVDTERNWYGFLANISVRTTGQLLFEFVYPAHRCCQNILFYPEDQLAVISPRMNCWQKEYLLRPEEDQILRLTPSFSWSGCHVTVHGGTDMFVCKGGRSFSVDSYGERLTTWYVAVSNCAAQHGLDLYYRIEIYGHVGDCVRQPPRKASQPLPGNRDASGSPRLENTRTGQRIASDRPNASVTKASLIPREAGGADPEQTTEPPVCVVEGILNSTRVWYGFIKNISLAAGGGYRYEFSYPRKLHTQSIILYNEIDIRQLQWELSCHEKEQVIGLKQYDKQIIEMDPRATYCRVSDGSIEGDNDTQTTTCRGERRYTTPQQIFMALSNCRSNNGVYLQYRLEIFGYTPVTFCSATTLYNHLSRIQIVAIAAAVASLFGRLNSHLQLYGPLLDDVQTSIESRRAALMLIYHVLGSLRIHSRGFTLTWTAIIATTITCLYLFIPVWKSKVRCYIDDFL